MQKTLIWALPAFCFACASSSPEGSQIAPLEPGACGPQAPRDISVAGGKNTLGVPEGETPNLCNVHFHRPYEHAGFKMLPEVAPSEAMVCGDVKNGDQIEAHWVYTNCDLPSTPKPSLENCVCDRPDMVLRVYTRAFVVRDAGSDFVQPTPEEARVKYAGSTTGTSFNNEVCSPARVNWDVDPQVQYLKRDALGAFCQHNDYHEHHAHAIRDLVVKPEWLSPFKP